MRTKSKDVRRRTIDQTLQGGVSVGAGTGVSSIDSAHDLNGSPVGSTVVQGSIHVGCLLDSGDGTLKSPFCWILPICMFHL